MQVGYGLVVCFGLLKGLLCWSIGGEGSKVAAARQQQCDAAISVHAAAVAVRNSAVAAEWQRLVRVQVRRVVRHGCA